MRKRMDDDARYEIVRQVQKIQAEEGINATKACKKVGVAASNYYKWAAQMEVAENAAAREQRIEGREEEGEEGEKTNGHVHARPAFKNSRAASKSDQANPASDGKLRRENHRLRTELNMYKNYLIDLLLGTKTPQQIIEEQASKLR